MSAPEQPAWLKEALSRRTNPQGIAFTPEICPGQVRVLNPMDYGDAPSRLVLVAAVDTELAVAQVILLSPETDMGSDLDRSVPSESTGLTFDLVALSDVVGPAWFVQLGALVSILVGDLNTHPVAGIALRDDQDARWAWKEGEHDALVALTAECRHQLLDGETVLVADPVAFDLAHVDWAERSCMSAAILPMLDANQVLIPVEVFGGRPIPKTSKAYESDHAMRLLIGRHKDRLLATGGVTWSSSAIRSIANDSLPTVLATAADRLDRSVRSIRVLSVASLWVGDDVTPAPHVREVVLGERRLQIVISEVEWDEVSCG